MPYKDHELQKQAKREWEKINRPAKAESYYNAKIRKRDLEKILKRKITWKEFELYDSGESIAPDRPHSTSDLSFTE